MLNGSVSPSRNQRISAPMDCRGSTTLAMGLRERDSSPSKTTSGPTGRNQPANRPQSRRAVVPLLAQLTSKYRLDELEIFSGPGETKVNTPSWNSASAPRERTAARLARVSALSSHPDARHGTPAKNPSRTARWEMDLSPGTETVPCRGSCARVNILARRAPPELGKSIHGPR